MIELPFKAFKFILNPKNVQRMSKDIFNNYFNPFVQFHKMSLEATEESIKNAIKTTDYLVFSKTYCPYATKVDIIKFINIKFIGKKSSW